MKKIFFSIILPIFISLIGMARQKARPVYFSGHITSNQDSISLEIAFNRNYITGQGEKENIFFEVPVDKRGNFHLSIPAIDNNARISLYDRVTSNFLLNVNLIEPGDSVYIDGIINDGENHDYFKAFFSGRGSAKYNCVQDLRSLGENDFKIANQKLAQRSISIGDSILFQKLNFLQKYKEKLTPSVYQIMKADISGEINNQILFGICRFLRKNLFAGKFSDSEIVEKQRNFKLFLNTRKADLASETLAMSPSYTDFIYQKSKWELAFTKRRADFGLKDIFLKLRDDNRGILKEKLLAYCLINAVDLFGLFDSTSTDDFTDCLKDAVATIKTPYLKHSVEDLLKAKGKGAAAFNFTLPADSSDRKVSLSDFKGKVVLIDMWAYQCTACAEFSQNFHKKVYPLFKDDPNFSVVSIMASASTKEKYIFRLRSTIDKYAPELSTYTYPDYINLFGGIGEDMGRAMAKHYDINTFPFLLLVDKHGKVYSSTVPFFTDPDSPNTERLIDLIKKALVEP